MINIVIPMAGAGSRFFKAGYTEPKYLIKVNDKMLLEHSLAGLPLHAAKKIFFVALQQHVNEFSLSDVLSNLLGKNLFEIITVPQITRGQAETVLACANKIDTSDDLMIFNIDTFYVSKHQDELLSDSQKKHDGFLGAFKAEGSKWSFAETDDQGFVTRTTEKVKISEHALTGLYHFSKGSDFVSVAKECIRDNETSAGEYYIAPMYNRLIAAGKKFVLDHVDKFIPLGTPEDISDAKGLL